MPPKERRGVVLIDPPFEQPDDFSRLAHGLEGAHRKWATGIYLLWYPIKDAAAVTAFIRKLRRSGIGKLLRLELIFHPSQAETGLRGSGLIVANPPWKLPDELKILLPALARALGTRRRRFHAGVAVTRNVTVMRYAPFHAGRNARTLYALALTFRPPWGVLAE